MAVRNDFIQINVRVSEDLRDKCREAAENNELSLVEWIRQTLQEKISGVSVEKDMEITRLRNELSKTLEYTHTLQSEVNQLRDAVDKGNEYRDECICLRYENESLKSECVRLQEDNDKLRADLIQCHEESIQLRNDNFNLKNDIAELYKNSDCSKNSTDELIQDISKRLSELEKLMDKK